MTFEHFLILLSSNFKHFGKSGGATASPYVRPCQAPEQNISDLYHGMQRQELYQQLRGPSEAKTSRIRFQSHTCCIRSWIIFLWKLLTKPQNKFDKIFHKN